MEPREEGCNHIKCPCGTHSRSLGEPRPQLIANHDSRERLLSLRPRVRQKEALRPLQGDFSLSRYDSYENGHIGSGWPFGWRQERLFLQMYCVRIPVLSSELHLGAKPGDPPRTLNSKPQSSTNRGHWGTGRCGGDCWGVRWVVARGGAAGDGEFFWWCGVGGAFDKGFVVVALVLVPVVEARVVIVWWP